MPARLRMTLVVAAALALAAVVAILLLARDDAEPATGGTGFAGAVRPTNIPPSEPQGLRDQDGDPVRLSEFRGRPVVVTFLYTTCEDTCPLTAQQIRGALDDLGEDVPVLAFSVDPANDTPERAKRFLLEQQMTGRMRFMLGSRAALQRQWDAYGIRPQKEDLEHTSSLVILDTRGRQRIGFPVDQLTPDGLAHDLRALRSDQAAS
ncbi:SCO family protein [Svornostia abyssi]|uniref:SCO family protein n=1 Tax=Svornostia abyssi TaxID=2898438 RepID=A0ABY5PFC6_9ACTN|nr:SCO family protein [Parviterribacteraceae bacterium J379]